MSVDYQLRGNAAAPTLVTSGTLTPYTWMSYSSSAADSYYLELGKKDSGGTYTWWVQTDVQDLSQAGFISYYFVNNTARALSAGDKIALRIVIPNYGISSIALTGDVGSTYSNLGTGTITCTSLSKDENGYWDEWPDNWNAQGSFTVITQSGLTGLNLIAGGGSTITKNQTGVSRISKVLTKTQTGISRIAKVTTKTQSAVAKIQSSPPITKTQTATAKIAQIYIKTQQSTARISRVSTKIQTATAKIGFPTYYLRSSGSPQTDVSDATAQLALVTDDLNTDTGNQIQVYFGKQLADLNYWGFFGGVIANVVASDEGGGVKTATLTITTTDFIELNPGERLCFYVYNGANHLYYGDYAISRKYLLPGTHTFRIQYQAFGSDTYDIYYGGGQTYVTSIELRTLNDTDAPYFYLVSQTDISCVVQTPDFAPGTTTDKVYLMEAGDYSVVSDIETYGTLVSTQSTGHQQVTVNFNYSGFNGNVAIIRTSNGIKHAYTVRVIAPHNTFSASETINQGSLISFNQLNTQGLFITGTDSFNMKLVGSDNVYTTQTSFQSNYVQTWASLDESQDIEISWDVAFHTTNLQDAVGLLYFSEDLYNHWGLTWTDPAGTRSNGRWEFYVNMGGNQYDYTHPAFIDGDSTAVLDKWYSFKLKWISSTGKIEAWAKNSGTWTKYAESFQMAGHSTEPHPIFAFQKYSTQGNYISTYDHTGGGYSLRNIRMVTGSVDTFSIEASRVAGTLAAYQCQKDSNITQYITQDSNTSRWALSSGTTGSLYSPVIKIPADRLFSKIKYQAHISGASTIKAFLLDSNGTLISDSILSGNSAGFSLSDGVNTISLSQLQFIVSEIQLKVTFSGSNYTNSFRWFNVDWNMLTPLNTSTTAKAAISNTVSKTQTATASIIKASNKNSIILGVNF